MRRIDYGTRPARARTGMRWLSIPLTAFAFSIPALAQQPPLSASDWLDSGAGRPPAREISAWRPGFDVPYIPTPPSADDPRPRARPGPADGPNPIGVSRLEGPEADAAGLLSPDDVGLPGNFWGDTPLNEILQLLRAPPPRLPVLDSAYRQVLTAQLAPPPLATGQNGLLFQARIDALMEMGAIDLAAALMDAAGVETRALFARRMDAALLLGDERRICATLTEKPGLAPDPAARIYCLAQSGDWQTAAIVMQSARFSGALPQKMLSLLDAYLDDAQVEDATRLTPPAPMTPLAFRLLEAVGQPMPTSGLPVAYAMADLRSNTGWKSRAEAAERAARAGNLGPRQLRAIYSEQPPAASGGVWDRVAAIQRLEAALSRGNSHEVAQTLQQAAKVMQQAGLGAHLAQMFGAELAHTPLPDGADAIARNLALVSADDAAWEMLGPDDGGDSAQKWLLALARPGDLPAQGAPQDGFGASLAAALQSRPQTDAVPTDAGDDASPDSDAAGMAFLRALHDIDAGREGDAMRATRGIAVLRDLGQERLARAAVLQLLLLPSPAERE